MIDGCKENCVVDFEYFEGSCIYISKYCCVLIYFVKNKIMMINKVLFLSYWFEFFLNL